MFVNDIFSIHVERVRHSYEFSSTIFITDSMCSIYYMITHVIKIPTEKLQNFVILLN